MYSSTNTVQQHCSARLTQKKQDKKEENKSITYCSLSFTEKNFSSSKSTNRAPRVYFPVGRHVVLVVVHVVVRRTRDAAEKGGSLGQKHICHHLLQLSKKVMHYVLFCA